MMEENEGWGAKSKRSASRLFLTSQFDELKSDIAALKQGVAPKGTKESEQSQEDDASAAESKQRFPKCGVWPTLIMGKMKGGNRKVYHIDPPSFGLHPQGHPGLEN